MCICVVSRCSPLPGIPPISNLRFSRIIFHDLEDDLVRLRAANGTTAGTAFVPHSIAIARSPLYNFFDEPHIEAVHFGKLNCKDVPFTFESEFSDGRNNNSRSGVSYAANRDKPECALPTPNRARTFLNLNEACMESIIPGESVVGLDFEPKCLMVVIAADSRKDLFDQLLAAKRPLQDKLRITVNYTLGIDPDPSVASISTNCENSLVMQENYNRDRILQDETQELEEVRENLTRAFDTLALFDETVDQLPAHALRGSLAPYRAQKGAPLPSPPPPPPPGLPGALSIDDARLRLTQEIGTMQDRVQFLVTSIYECDRFGPTRERVCGIPANEGPSPWLSKSGEQCRGYDTFSARFGDFCGYWDASVRVHACILFFLLRQAHTQSPTTHIHACALVWVYMLTRSISPSGKTMISGLPTFWV